MTRQPCVVTKVYGGLGNQLFQYAAGRRLAQLHGRPLFIDLDWFNAIPGGSTPRKPLLSELAIVASIARPASDARTPDMRSLGLWQRLFGPWRVVKERMPFRYDARVLRPLRHAQSVLLDGYWQSYRYFEPIREQLLQEIVPRRPTPLHYASAAEHIASCESVMLHIRRGDYVNSSAAALFGSLPLAYYLRAIEQVRARVAAPEVFVFSDDLPWARANLVTGCETVFVESDRGDDAVVHELELMRSCKHQIIANSSLSWWAAWLNRHEEKTVVAPQRWLAGETVPLDDLIPPGWQLLPVD